MNAKQRLNPKVNAKKNLKLNAKKTKLNAKKENSCY